MAPKVSVIIPNYNHAKFLPQRIDSVLDQTFRDFEVILLDDCSSDESVNVIETYRGHSKVSHIIINEQNSGSTFKQWKKGIELARGEWIWIAESDDWCEPAFLETLLKSVDENTALTFCQSVIVDENGNKTLELNLYKEFKVLPGFEFIANDLSKGNPIVNASMCIFREKLYHNVSDEFTNYKFSGDWIFWTEIAAQGNVVICEKVLNYFRKHKDDVSGKANIQGLGYREYFSFLNKFGDYKLIPAHLRNEVFSHMFFKFLNDKIIEKKFRKPIFREFSSRLGYKLYLLQIRNLFNVNMKRRLKKVFKNV